MLNSFDSISLGTKVVLKTALWVPCLFGVAGIIMTTLILIFDEKFSTSLPKKNPSWPKTLYAISLFSGQYYFSGLLDNIGVDSLTINILLSVIAILGYLIFDSSFAGK